MKKAFVITSDNKELKSKYPDLPFIVKDEFNDLWMVVYDPYDDKYKYISLSYEENRGEIHALQYDSLDDMFMQCNKDKILVTELRIVGEY